MKEIDRTIRSANTTDFLKLCCLVVPKETKPILDKIISADLKIKNCLGELCMSSNPLEVVEQIEKIREENNKNWMDLIRLAVTHAPEEAKVIMNRINKHDENINELFQQLSDTL